MEEVEATESSHERELNDNLQDNNNRDRKGRRRILRFLAIFIGILLIIGCFVMASYSYIFLDNCKETSCHEASVEKITTAKVFRFISAGFFIIGVFMVAFSLCTNRPDREIDNSDLRRISMHTVACIIPESAKEKSPSVFCTGAYSNPALTCSISALNNIPDEDVNDSCGSQQRTSCTTSTESIRGLFDYKSNVNLTPPPSYMEALRMQIPNETVESGYR